MPTETMESLLKSGSAIGKSLTAAQTDARQWLDEATVVLAHHILDIPEAGYGRGDKEHAEAMRRATLATYIIHVANAIGNTNPVAHNG